jgi:DNA-binding NtrC family response regulator
MTRLSDAAARILVVDDEKLLLQTIASTLRRHGFQVEVAADVAAASQQLDSSHFDLVLADTYLAPDRGGFEVLERARKQPVPPMVVMMSGRAEVRLAVESMRRGAIDFIEKPIDLAELVLRLERALETATMRRRLDLLEAAELDRANAVAVSPAMRRVMEIADRVAASPASSALILGESGVGKEVVAARIHQASRRRSAPFVKVNLAAIPDSMIEADLFGSLRGAYTDAKRDRPGLFMSADGGTILLDELCEFRVDLQPKLLRVLEQRRFFPVGSDRERSIDVRVLAATNRDPLQAVESGRLRADLYYRLGTVTIDVPPLRERQEDILPLARHFLLQLCAEFARGPATLRPAAERALLRHPWPGNVRELRNAIERALMLTDGDAIDEEDLALPTIGSRERLVPFVREPAPEELRPSERVRVETPGRTSVTLEAAKQEALEAVEREHIAKALEAAGGSRTRAAQMLGMSRTTLWEKAKRYGLA